MLAEWDKARGKELNKDFLEQCAEQAEHCGEPICNAENISSTTEIDDTYNASTQRKSEYHSLFLVSVKEDRQRKYVHDYLLEAATAIADDCLRERGTLPAYIEKQKHMQHTIDSGERLPPVCCAFKNCSWVFTEQAGAAQQKKHSGEHPWDRQLHEHVMNVHSAQIKNSIYPILPPRYLEQEGQSDIIWDIYKQALAVNER